MRMAADVHFAVFTPAFTFTVLTVSLFTDCKKHIYTQRQNKSLIETLLKEDDDKALDHFAMEHEMAKNTGKEAMKKGFADFRELVVKNFGTELNSSFMESEEKFSTNAEENTTCTKHNPIGFAAYSLWLIIKK